MRLQDRVVLITGAAGGIGSATARTFARNGARLILWDVDREAVDELAGSIGESGGQPLWAVVDVSQAGQVEEGVSRAVQELGPIDVLINNAGIIRDAQFLHMTAEELNTVLDVNLKGVFHCTQTVARRMAEAGRGKIVSISSTVGLHGNFGQTNYAASKAAVIGMTRTWARELGPLGIRVNAVAPGFIRTPMVRAVPDGVVEALRRRVPLGRLGEPEDIANLLLFLASDESDYIHGAVIEIDGGLRF